jgi:hypothetical protein
MWVVVVAPTVEWNGLLIGVMFSGSFIDDVTYVGEFKFLVECMICNKPGRIFYGSENFVLGSLHDYDVGFAGATPQFYSYVGLIIAL